MRTNRTKSNIDASLMNDLEFRKWALEQAIIYTANHNYTLQSAFNHICCIATNYAAGGIDKYLVSSRVTEMYNMKRRAEMLVNLVKSGDRPRFGDIVLSDEQFGVISKLVTDDPEYLKYLSKYVPADYNAFTSVK